MIENADLPPSCIVRRPGSQDKWTFINIQFLGAAKKDCPIVITVFFFFYLLGTTVISCVVADLIAGLNNKSLLVFYLILIETVMLFFWKNIHDKIAFTGEANNANYWLIEYDSLVVGYGLVSRHRSYSMLDSLYIVPAFRAQGLGSFLVRHIIAENIKPIYLFCNTSLISFYTRFGFVSASRQQLRYDYRLRSLPHNILVLPESVDSTPSPTYIAKTKDTLPADRIIRQANKCDRAKIRQFIFTSSTIDLFLPFGITPFLISAIYLSVVSLLPISLTLVSIAFLINIPIPYRELLTISFSTTVLLPLGLTIFSYFQMQNWAQFYLVESNNKLIAYARLSKRNNFFIIHHIHICGQSNLYRQQLTNEILQYLVDLDNKPIYIACEAALVNLYKRFDFVTIATSNLPLSLQFGANLNRRFGGGNLVLR